MRARCRPLVVLTGLWLSLISGMANAPATPAQQETAEARAKASEALADSLMPGAPQGASDKNLPGNRGPAPAGTEAGAKAVPRPAADKSRQQRPAVANLFTIPGAAVVLQARAAGYHFSPAGAAGVRDGIHTTASQYKDAVSSEIDGVAMRQFRPATNWAVPATTNKFYMFVEADLKPAPLAAGWKIRGINLKGTNWKWVDGPQTGAPSASFVIAITAGKFGPVANEVLLDELVLEGPPGETNWRNAFAPKLAVVPKSR